MAAITRVGIAGSSAAYLPFLPKSVVMLFPANMIIATQSIVEIQRTVAYAEPIRSVTFDG